MESSSAKNNKQRGARKSIALAASLKPRGWGVSITESGVRVCKSVYATYTFRIVQPFHVLSYHAYWNGQMPACWRVFWSSSLAGLAPRPLPDKNSVLSTMNTFGYRDAYSAHCKHCSSTLNCQAQAEEMASACLWDLYDAAAWEQGS